MRYIYLIRHGEVAWNSEGAYVGATDLPLNDTGRSQAKRLADWLSSKEITAVYTSDLSRALETSQIIAEPHKLSVILDNRFREINYGEWEGLTSEQIADRYPDLSNRWKGNADVLVPGGESINQMIDRAYTAFIETVYSHMEGNIVIVAHKSVNRTILCRLLDIPVGNYRVIGQANSCVNVLHVRKDDSITVNTINDRCHLRD